MLVMLVLNLFAGCIQILENHGKLCNLKYNFSRPGQSWNLA